MLEVIEKIWQKSKYFLLILTIFVLALASSEPASAKNYLDYENVQNKKDKQFMRKIEIIHQTFESQTDIAALYATIAHRGNLSDYINESYDSNWDEDKFKENTEQLKTMYPNVKSISDILASGFINIKDLLDFVLATTTCIFEGEPDLECAMEKIINDRVTQPTHNYEKKVKATTQHQSIDLLTAATIVMIDSSGYFGQYSDENYKKALAGNGLIGNLADDAVHKYIASMANGTFCLVGAASDVATGGISVDLFTNGFNPINVIDEYAEFGGGTAFLSPTLGKLNRYYTMSQICKKGFIGGTYSAVQNMESEQEYYQIRKEGIADEIIELAQEYRKLMKEDNSFCLTGGNTQATAFKDMTTEQYLAVMGPIAQADYSRSNIFASVTLAQSIIESGWGKSGLTQKANNLFGIKCNGNWTGECINMATGEYGANGYYTTNAGFRKYSSVEASVSDHSLFLIENSRYASAGAFSATNYADQIKAIHNAGYATDPSYASTIIGTIKQYGLDKWDVKANTTSTSSACSPVGMSGWTIRTIKPSPGDAAFNYVNSNRGQCVWYAQGRAIEIVEELGKNGKLTSDQVTNIKNKLLQAYGNGGDIYDNTRSEFNGSSNIKEPKAGSYIVWKKTGGYGHVAIIEDVNTIDNTITITEGWTNNGSCPDSWDCIQFQNQTFNLDDFYSNYGLHYTGGYNFSGYVYFLETK